MDRLDRQLFRAVAAGDLDATRAAIAAGADVNCIDFTGETDWAGYDPVDVAAEQGRADIVRELMAAGAVNRVFVDWRTPGSSASGCGPSLTTRGGT